MSEQPKQKAVRKPRQPRVKKDVLAPIALIEDAEGIQQMPVILFATEPTKKPRAPRKPRVTTPAPESPAAEPAAETSAEPTAESSAAPEPHAAMPAFDATVVDCYCSGCRQTKSADKFGSTKRGKTRKTCIECAERVRAMPPPYMYNRLKGKVVLPNNCTWDSFGITWVLKLKTAPELALTLRDLLDALSPANMQAVEL